MNGREQDNMHFQLRLGCSRVVSETHSLAAIVNITIRFSTATNRPFSTGGPVAEISKPVRWYGDPLVQIYRVIR